MTRPNLEAVVTAAAGATLAGAIGGVVGLTVPAAIVGGANGAISGWRGVYDWRSARGVGAFALDSTWALCTTAAGLAAHGIGNLRGDPGYDQALSHRHNRHVYRRGFQIRRGFAVTIGNVVNGAADTTSRRRVKLVTDHEDVHVWQARWFGPAYPVLYAGWMIGGGVAGAAAWVASDRTERLGRYVETCGYYLNPFEWWAYSRDAHWPPSGVVSGLGWRSPAVRPFAARRGEAGP